MGGRQIPWQLIAAATVFALGNACGGSGSDGTGDGSPHAGSMSGVSGASLGGSPAGGGSGGPSGSGGTAGQGGAVDCNAVCAHVKMLCPERTDIDDVWLSACKSVCDARTQLTPDTARLEQTCVQGAATCNASIICVATPG